MARPAPLAAISACATTALLLAACEPFAPGCRNRDVKASIERDASTSLELQSSQAEAKSPKEMFVLSDAFETSSSGDTRSCEGKLTSSKTSVAVPIEYQVINAGDRKTLYRWDNIGFGKLYIAASIMGALKDAAERQNKAKAESAASSPPEQDGSAGPDAANSSEARQQAKTPPPNQTDNTRSISDAKAGIENSNSPCDPLALWSPGCVKNQKR